MPKDRPKGKNFFELVIVFFIGAILFAFFGSSAMAVERPSLNDPMTLSSDTPSQHMEKI